MKRDYVTGINFYPLKSARAATVNGEIPTSLPVGRTGFMAAGVRDRDFVLFDPADNCFVSQRGWDANRRLRHRMDRRLATVALDVRKDHVQVSSDAGHLELSNAPLPGKRMTLDIFGKQFPVVEQGADASRYFSALLEREVLLVRSDHDNPRLLPERYRRAGAFNEVAGADGFPFLLASEASLAAAHQRNNVAPGTVPINRYRGNIVISGDGIGPFGEDFIDGDVMFQIGDVGMWTVKACSRCPIPNIDQESGEREGGGLSVLRGRVGSIFTGEEGSFFGQNLTHANRGFIAVGSPVIIDAIKPEPNIMFRDAG